MKSKTIYLNHHISFSSILGSISWIASAKGRDPRRINNEYTGFRGIEVSEACITMKSIQDTCPPYSMTNITNKIKAQILQ